jgi:hypothetical protein
MVAMLWAEGKCGATVQLESLWNKLHHEDGFTLYCAYPRTASHKAPTNRLKQFAANIIALSTEN